MSTVIVDTCDVVFKRKSDKKVIFTAEAKVASIEQTVSESQIRGGIGNGVLAVYRTDKELKGKVTNALYDAEWLEMVTGTKFVEGTANVFAEEAGVVCKAAGELEIKGTPVENTISVIAEDGTPVAGTPTFSTKKISLEGLTENSVYTVQYQTSVSGKILTVDISKYPENYEVEYHTIEYDPETNEVVKDLYWQFDKVTPSAQFSYSYEAGQPIGSEIDFTICNTKGTKEVGRAIEVVRT